LFINIANHYGGGAGGFTAAEVSPAIKQLPPLLFVT